MISWLGMNLSLSCIAFVCLGQSMYCILAKDHIALSVWAMHICYFLGIHITWLVFVKDMYLCTCAGLLFVLVDY